MNTPLTEYELIGQAREIEPAETLLDALEAIWGSGFADDSAGDVAGPFGYVYRVNRWLVFVDNDGFRSVRGYATEAEAVVEMDVYHQQEEGEEEPC